MHRIVWATTRAQTSWRETEIVKDTYVALFNPIIFMGGSIGRL